MLHIPRRTALLVGTVVLALSAAACAPGNPDVDTLAATQGLPNLEVSLSAREWLLDPADSSISVGDAPITLDIHPDDTVSGIAPCNTYRGSVTFGDDTVTFTDLSTTLISCDPQVMDDEAAFFAALASVRDVDLTDRDRLVLTSPDGVRLAFDAFRAYDAIVGTWTVVNIGTDDALTTLPAGVEATIAFDDEYAVVVDAGCGPRSGTWALDDDSLTVEDLSPSESCASADAASVEATVVSGLSGTRSVQISPNMLTVIDPDDTIALVATR